MTHEKLAFCKKDGKPWTLEEYNNILIYCEGEDSKLVETMDPGESRYKYIYDALAANPETKSTEFMCLQSSTHNENFKLCTKVSYESIFHPTKLTSFSIKDY